MTDSNSPQPDAIKANNKNELNTTNHYSPIVTTTGTKHTVTLPPNPNWNQVTIAGLDPSFVSISLEQPVPEMLNNLREHLESIINNLQRRLVDISAEYESVEKDLNRLSDRLVEVEKAISLHKKLDLDDGADT